ncbi:DUF4430 domain-containing protein [Desulfofalx alkaliphila]|uniref:DUF4430 domain-containing protein n=1 Tax=Desulfofalx alkaliphila TaxID=105483 RepID=UPI0004E1DBD1|nr:DUF4430 domain-containing protein [Desulfofalx alkaliphila]
MGFLKRLGIVAVLVAVAALAFYGYNSLLPKTSGEETFIEVVVSRGTGDEKEILYQQKIPVTKGQTVLSAMKDNFELELDYNESFVVGINGILASEDDQTAWFYSVNDKMPHVGAASYKLEGGERVEFNLRPWDDETNS